LRGTVDMTTGTLEFEDVTPGASGATSGATRAIYGDQNVLVKLYNTTVVVNTVAGTKTWTGNVGLRNLTAHEIGDEQALVAPDTMGVFVFFTAEPTVTAPVPCPGCTVTITRYDGTGNFSATGQKYFWWRDRVAANDTTKTRKVWSFSAPSTVTAFSFTVMVSAAWPTPSETRWKVVLNNDSLPDTQEEPPWIRVPFGPASTATASGGALTIATAANLGELDFYRRDSVRTTTSAYIEARLRTVGGIMARPAQLIAFDDGIKSVGLGVSNGQVWFADSSHTFLAGAPIAITTTTMTTYQLRKYGADSVVFWYGTVTPSTRGGKFTYASLPGTAVPTIAPFEVFGQRAMSAAGVSSVWEYVLYEIGSPFP
jgi:hypothetical protein